MASRPAASVAVLAGGVAVLALGTAYALRRDGGTAPAVAPDSLAAAGALPVLDVTYVQLPLAAYQAAVAGEASAPLPFSVVPTEVEARIRTDRPPLRPDFGTLFHVREHDGVPSTLGAFARAFREKRVANERMFVVGLLVEHPTPGPPVRLRLEVERRVLRGFREMLDPTDATEAFTDDSASAAHVESRGRAQVEWESRPAGGAQLVPLFLLHGYQIPNTPENQEVIEEGGQQYWWRVGSYTILGPRRLFARIGNGPEGEIDISRALSSPLFVEGLR